MNTYLKNTSRQIGESEFVAVRASRSDVSKLDCVLAGKWEIVPASKKLLAAARVGVNVPTMRILEDGRLGRL